MASGRDLGVSTPVAALMIAIICGCLVSGLVAAPLGETADKPIQITGKDLPKDLAANPATFRLLVFTDTHYGEDEAGQWGPRDDRESSAAMTTVMAREPSDLVVFLGDQVTGNSVRGNNATLYWSEAVAPAVVNNRTFASTFGNHDDLSPFANGTKEDLLAMDMSFYPISRTQCGPKTISGVTNYYLPVWRTANGSLSLDEAAGGSASAPSWIVFFFDSGGGNEQPGYVMPSQVAWFNETAAGLATRWGKVPIVAFMHIPLPEFMDLWNNGTVYGWNNDSIACQDVNSGLFDAFAANGNVRLVVSGHNHQNNFCGTWRNVSLCYGQHSGYGGYGINGVTITGSRVIELYDGPVPAGRRPWEARRDGGAARILRIDGADQDPFAVGGATWGFATYIRHQDGTILPRGPTHPPCADNSGGVDGCVQTKCTDPLGP